MEEIAVRADVGVGTLYRRFPNKADLLNAVVEAAHERKRQIAETVLADVAPEDGVFEFVRRCIAVPSCWRATIAAPPWRYERDGTGPDGPATRRRSSGAASAPGRSVPTSRCPTSSWCSWRCGRSPTSATRNPPSRRCASSSSCSTVCGPGTNGQHTTRSPSPSSTASCAAADRSALAAGRAADSAVQVEGSPHVRPVSWGSCSAGEGMPHS